MATTRAAGTTSPWEGFNGALWQREINVRAFIQLNYTPYEGRGFPGARDRPHEAIWDRLKALFVEERKTGVLDISQMPSSITAHEAGYINRENEIIVGLQTEAPLKRAIMPNGGLRMVLSALEAYGYTPDPHIVETFTKYRKTHNDGVFDAYTADIRRCRNSHVLTGLPDAYGRGRIIGDYRRVALYGVDRLIDEKKREKKALDGRPHEDMIRDREELAEQIRALGELKTMAASYGFDISGPGADRARSRARARLRLPGGGQGAERRRDVSGPLLDVPGHLLRARSGGRAPHRGGRAGDHRRLRDQAAHRSLPAHAGI